MQFNAALIKEQGITFAIVVVKSYIIQNPSKAEESRVSFSALFPNMPIILMAQDSRRVPTYRGRRDIVKFLANIDLTRIPWRKYTI